MLSRLRTGKARKKEGLVLVEGVRAVTQVLDAGAEVRFVVRSDRIESTNAGLDLVERIVQADLNTIRVTDQELAVVADTEHPQGVLLVCEEQQVRLSDVLQIAGCYLVLDGVQDPGNVGTLIRAAAAFSIDGVITLEGTADIWAPKPVRASAGTIFQLPIVHAVGEEAIQGITRVGMPILVADPAAENMIAKPDHRGFALVVGNEGVGPRQAILDAAEHLVKVPISEQINSLNVGVAGAILMYELTKKDD